MIAGRSSARDGVARDFGRFLASASPGFVRTTSIVSVAVILAACGGASDPRIETHHVISRASSSRAVSLSTSPVYGLGTVLVDSQGRTLYTFAPDAAKKVTCTGSCAQLWPPLKATPGQKLSVSAGVKASLVSTVPDRTGGRVVTYAGWPLYLYTADHAAGDAHGQALELDGGVWYAIGPSGTLIRTHAKKTDRHY
jgi:predicted lipoprotein with Yx(FWY)xxD motif